MSGKNASSADNQQERLVKNFYLAGFIDGEGCFYVGIVPSKYNKIGWQVICEFHVSQNAKGLNILEDIKTTLKCGYIKRNHPASQRDKTFVFVAKNEKDLTEKVLPFFEKHPLISGKKDDFEKFKQVMFLRREKQHLTTKGLKKVVELAYSMNSGSARKILKKKLLKSLD